MAKKQAEILIMGVIGADIFSEDGGITAKLIKSRVEEIEEEEILVNISSPGGSVNEGFAIHDILKNSGKKIITQGHGIVASIATVIFMAGEERLLAENADFMIHNSKMFLPEEGFEADELQRAADEALRVENKILGFYSRNLKHDEEEIAKWMNEETTFTPDEAIKAGFATGKIGIESKLKAVAYIDTNILNMDKKNEKESLSLLDKIKALVTPKATNESQAGTISIPRCTNLSLDSGEIIVVESENKDLIGGKVFKADNSGNKLDEVIESGNLVLANNQTLILSEGVVSDVVKTDETSESVDALKKENEKLKAEVIALKDNGSEAFKLVEKEIEGLKAIISSSKEPPESGKVNVVNTGMSAIQQTQAKIQEKINTEYNKR